MGIRKKGLNTQLLMVLCCLIPLAALAAVSIFRVPANTVIFVAIVLACPAMHLFMMKGMIYCHCQLFHKTSEDLPSLEVV